jgi:hypothetical protein
MIQVVLWFLVVVIWDVIIPLKRVEGSIVNAFRFIVISQCCYSASCFCEAKQEPIRPCSKPSDCQLELCWEFIGTNRCL